MKGLNFLEGMNLTLQKPFVIRFLAKINMREREMCKKIQQIQRDQHVHTRAPPRTVNR